MDDGTDGGGSSDSENPDSKSGPKTDSNPGPTTPEIKSAKIMVLTWTSLLAAIQFIF